MPRGRTGGSTAALIEALAQLGVRASPYQIERWRASGDLPRPQRRGLGRGRGVGSVPPDEKTVLTAAALARASRRGSPRVGGHTLERLALGRPVAEADVREAFSRQLDQIGRMLHAHIRDEDAGWQAREDVARRAAAREPTPVRWDDLINAVAGQGEPHDLAREEKHAAFAGLIHTLGEGREAEPEALIDAISLLGGFTSDDRDRMRKDLVAAQLAGDESWSAVADMLSLGALRQTLANATLDELRRAASVAFQVEIWHTLIMTVGLLDVAGEDTSNLGSLARFNAEAIRQVQSEPMWPLANLASIGISKPKQRIRRLALMALGYLHAGNLTAWEAYRDRLVEIAHPPEYTH